MKSGAQSNVTIFEAEAVKAWDCLTDFPLGTSAVEDSDQGHYWGLQVESVN